MRGRASSNDRFPSQIVVGIEDDPRSDDVLDAALALSRRFRAGLELVHAFPEALLSAPRADGLPPGTLDSAAELAIRSRLSTRTRTLLAALENEADPPRLQLLPGSPAAVLLERIETIGADLVVLGPHRHRRVLEQGSTTRTLLAEGPLGVWTQIGPWRPLEKILVPLDLSAESWRALEIARALAQGCGSRVIALHCFLVPTLGSEPLGDAPYPAVGHQTLEGLREASRVEFERAIEGFDWGGVGYERRFEEGDPTGVILEHSTHVDLVVIGTHGRTGLAAALLGNVADGVLAQSARPVLAIRRTLRDLESSG